MSAFSSSTEPHQVSRYSLITEDELSSRSCPRDAQNADHEVSQRMSSDALKSLVEVQAVRIEAVKTIRIIFVFMLGDIFYAGILRFT